MLKVCHRPLRPILNILRKVQILIFHWFFICVSYEITRQFLECSSTPKQSIILIQNLLFSYSHLCCTNMFSSFFPQNHIIKFEWLNCTCKKKYVCVAIKIMTINKRRWLPCNHTDIEHSSEKLYAFFHLRYFSFYLAGLLVAIKIDCTLPIIIVYLHKSHSMGKHFF
jgi:hypothetical protein